MALPVTPAPKAKLVFRVYAVILASKAKLVLMA
jgi:hypothetical protein